MNSIKTALEQGWTIDALPRSLQAQLDAVAPAPDDRGLHRLTLRLPKAVVRELRDLAQSRGSSVNEFVATLIDEGLVREGRPSIAEVAPWFAGYLRRAADPRRADERPIFE